MMRSLFLQERGYLRGTVLSACIQGLCGAVLSISLLATPAAPQDDVARRRAEYDRESDPVDKAKKLPKLGDALFAAARRALRQEDYAASAKLVEEYRDKATQSREAMRAAVPNPEKKPAGFKHLEIHVRRSLQRLADLIAEAPLNQRAPFEAVRTDLEKLNRQLLLDLFPRQPGGKPARSQPRSQP